MVFLHKFHVIERKITFHIAMSVFGCFNIVLTMFRHSWGKCTRPFEISLDIATFLVIVLSSKQKAFVVHLAFSSRKFSIKEY